MDIFTFRIISIGAILAISLVGGLAPLTLKLSSGTDRFFALGNALAAGAFLSAGLIHMMPDGMGALESAGLEPEAAHFQIALLAIAGFALGLLLERVALRQVPQITPALRANQPAAASHQHGGAVQSASTGSSVVMAYTLLLLLSAHSVVAGMALGAETNVAEAFVILFAIVAHKGTEAFALGVNLIRGGLTTMQARVAVSLFSWVTPLGILAGAIMRGTIEASSAGQMEGIFDGLAAGTFLYIAASHIIPEEFESANDRWAKFGLLLLGLAIMTSVGLVV